MLQSVPMVHMQIQVPNRDAAAVTQHIAAQGLLHLIDIAHGRILAADAAPTGTREQLAVFRELARRIRRTAERLDLPLPEPTGPLSGDVHDFAQAAAEIDQQLRPLETQVDSLWNQRAEARETAARAQASEAHAARMARVGLAIERVRRASYTAFTLGLVRADELPTLASVLAPAPFALLPLDVSGDTVLTLAAVPASSRDRLDGALRVVSFETIALDETAAVTPDAAAAAARTAAEQEQNASAALARVCEQAHPLLVALAQRAELGVLLLQAQTHFAAAGRFVVISGWIPEAQASRLGHAVAALTDSHAIVDIQKPEDLPQAAAGALKIPILYRNPVLLRPFQMLVQMYGVPAYGEIPPTAFFAISFLLMFGFMFGDAGHGLVLFSAGYCLWRYLPRYLDYGVLLMECGAASFTFGLLYGSVFGVEGVLPVLWMEPIRDLERFMGTAVLFGVVLVSVGLILNMVNSWRAGERESAILGAHGVFGAFIYWIAVALVARALVPSRFMVPGPVLVTMIAIAVSLLVLRRPIVKLLGRGGAARTAHPDASRWLVALEASVELVDSLFAFFANTISFVRVAAFAAVHAGVFIAMFALAETMAQLRFGQPLAILTLIAGNVVMILLEGLTVSVQVLRLEYYEFFGKFFRGGGQLYRPLMLKKGGAS
jgi:V/A-type H+-transporting ATPase subunit I